MKKFLSALLIAGSVWGLAAVEPIISLPLNEGDFARIKDNGTAKARVVVENPQFLKWSDGPDGKALEFRNPDGNSPRGTIAVRMPDSFDLSKGFSMSFMVKTNKDFARKRIHTICRYADGVFKAKGVNVFLYWDMIYFRMSDSADNFQNISSKTSDQKIAANRWYNIIVTFDGKIARIYWDNKLAAEGELKVANPDRTSYLMIGASGDGAGYGFNGIICNVNVYDKALTAEEIAALKQDEE